MEAGPSGACSLGSDSGAALWVQDCFCGLVEMNAL